MSAKTWAPFIKLPNRLAIYGASGSGKTSYLLGQILRRDDNPLSAIIWLAPSFSLEQPEIAEMAKAGALVTRGRDGGAGRHIAFKTIAANADGWEEKTEDTLRKAKAAGLKVCVVLDDLLALRGKPRAFLVNLYTAGRHLSVDLLVEMSQRIFGGADSRTCRLNCQHQIVGRLGGPSEFTALTRQLYPDKKKRDAVVKAYETVTASNPHGFLWLDTSAKAAGDEDLEIRTGYDECVELEM